MILKLDFMQNFPLAPKLSDVECIHFNVKKVHLKLIKKKRKREKTLFLKDYFRQNLALEVVM